MKALKNLLNYFLAWNQRSTLIAGLMLFFIFPSAFSQEPVTADENDNNGKIEIYNDEDWELFEEDTPLRFSLSFDRKLFRKNTMSGEYQPAQLSIHLTDSVVEREIRIRARGISRKTICTFPPIKLNLKDADLDNTQLEQQSTLKFVTHCKNSKTNQIYLFKEYLVYKLYNVVTDFSLRVRLVQVDYIDSNQKQKTFTKYGFLIEHIDKLAERQNCVEVENEQLAQKWMSKEIMPLLCVFQYMIGNTDWSLAGLHNIKVLKSNNYATTEPYPIPYDFDYAGLVDADYAVPTEGLGLTTVKERAYRCICFGDETSIFKSVDLINSKKEELYKVIEDFEFLEKKDKAFMFKYLDQYFDLVDNDKVIRREMIDACLK